MKLSIVLPTYNQEKLLGRCLDSLLDQELSDDEYEIIIVNDASTDNTLKIANEYALRHQQVKVITRENGGAGAARNTGMDIAKGEYIHFVDPDDYVTHNCYKYLLKLATELNPEILCFQHEKTRSGNEITPVKAHQQGIKNPEMYSGKEFIAKFKYHNEVWWYLINRKFLVESGVRFIEGKWMEDVILTPTIFLECRKLCYCSIDVYRHVIMPNSAMTSKEPSHYNKLIQDIEDATYVFDKLLQKIPGNDPETKACRDRIKSKQESMVFFMLVRLMKSNLPVNSFKTKLNGFKAINAYPLNNFIGKDYNGFGFKFLTYVFNKEHLIAPFMNTFRFLYRPAMQIYSLF